MNAVSTDLDERVTSIDLVARRQERFLRILDCYRESRRWLRRAPCPYPMPTIEWGESCIINFSLFRPRPLTRLRQFL